MRYKRNNPQEAEAKKGRENFLHTFLHFLHICNFAKSTCGFKQSVIKYDYCEVLAMKFQKENPILFTSILLLFLLAMCGVYYLVSPANSESDDISKRNEAILVMAKLSEYVLNTPVEQRVFERCALLGNEKGVIVYLKECNNYNISLFKDTVLDSEIIAFEQSVGQMIPERVVRELQLKFRYPN
jgi:hypothetical protein